MNIRPIHTKKQHTAARAEVERLVALDPKRGTPDGDRLEVLAILVERYEKEHFPIAPPTPIEAIEFHMDRLGLRQADLIPYIGSSGRVSEVLSGSRKLTIPMLEALHANLGIPLESLLPGVKKTGVRSRARGPVVNTRKKLRADAVTAKHRGVKRVSGKRAATPPSRKRA